MAIGNTPIPGRYAARAPEERVCYTLRALEKRHRSGVNALALGTRRLYSAGRDGVVRVWRLPEIYPLEPVSDHPEAVAALDEHVDWVNAALLVHREERLITASSDTTIKVWNTASTTSSLRTLVEHSDYVKALSSLSDGAVVSGSLDGRILLWDLVTGRVRLECSWYDPSVSSAASNRPSIYCLASSPGEPQTNLIVSGSTDRIISLYDARSGENIVRMRGHADAIRCLAIKHDSTQLLSGSSDSTVRLWDIRQQRCIRTFDYPSDSVWALDTDREFHSFVSGGRDGTVWHSNIDGDNASLVVAVADTEKRCNMILDLKFIRDEGVVWVSTTGSTIRLWSLPLSKAHKNHLSGNGQDVIDEVELKMATTRQTDVNSTRDFIGNYRKPLLEFQGLPAIIAYKILNNRRHVLTCDTANELAVWDITAGVKLRVIGMKPEGQDLDQIADDIDEIVSVPSWFQVDIRLGSLSVRLDRNNVSNAEVYAIDAGLDIESEDVKVNIGEHVVRGLFAGWLSQISTNAANQSSSAPGPATARPTLGNVSDRSQAQGQSPAQRPQLPPYKFPPDIPITVTEESPVPILQRQTGTFCGESDTSYLPTWAIEIVRDGRSLSREVPKIGFTLCPVEGSHLRELSASSLNAPRVLRIRKVASYVAKELNLMSSAEANHHDEIQSEDLDILCHGKPLPSNMNLATARQFKWRSPEDLQLTFRLKSKVRNSVIEDQ